MSVFDAILVTVYFEVGVPLGCGFALYLKDECTGPSEGAYRYV
jgi:hypothetical protein